MARSAYVVPEKMRCVLGALLTPNAIACEIALETGLRISDVLAVTRDQFGERFTVTEKKTGKKRAVRVPVSLVERARALGGENDTYLFPGRFTGHRSRQTVYDDVVRAAKAFRLPHVTPHSFRKVYGVRKFEETGSLDAVRRAFGHDHAETTMLYAMADKIPDEPKRRRKRKT